MRQKKGIIVSNKQNKTLVVVNHRYVNHPKYKKRYRVSKKFHVHNPEEKHYEIGEEITFYETNPISKMKKWTLKKPNIKDKPKIS